MSKPTRRKISNSKPRARSDSARFIAPGQVIPSQPKKKANPKSKNSGISDHSYIWTKEKPKRKQGSKTNDRKPGTAKTLFSTFGHGLGIFFGTLFSFMRKSRFARIVGILICLLLVFGAIDLGMNWEKIYQGIKVGEVDLSGKTAEEAEKLLETTYGPRLMNTHVYVFAHEEASEDLEASLKQTQDQNFAEQRSVEEVRAHKLVWQTDAGSLGANLDTKEMVQKALALGREEGGIFARLNALLSGFTIEPWARYDETAIEALAQDIDLSIGEPRVNYDITIVKGYAEVIDGHDGMMINRDTFKKEFDKALLMIADHQASFVAQTEYAALQIDELSARQTCDIVNQTIRHGVRFLYHGVPWDVDAIELGSWIQTRIVEEDKNSWKLEPFVSYDHAKSSLVSHLRANFNETEIKISFANNNGNIMVHTQSSGTMPKSKEAIDLLNEKLFSAESPSDSQVIIEAESTPIPEILNLQDALDTGVVEKMSEFTTEYTAHVENRNHNIHLVASFLNNSIVNADGGIWSFNETAGNCNEEAGFRGAGSIINGEYVDEIGGGICQVATTVFNAVYNSGLPIIQRHNHSLYIASYPAGRDAAVSWPDLDLRWKNNTSSDILVQTSYTNTSITVVLYGINPDHEVSTKTSNWEEGEKFKKRTVTDETLAPDESYVKIQGSDGSKITVIRTVKNKEGNLLYENTFTSVYEPIDEITVEGPKKEEQSTAGERTTG